MVAKAVLMPPKANKTELLYAAAELRPRLLAGEIKRYDFEVERLRLADNTFYTPDWRVVMADDTIEFHEVKGFLREAAFVRIKVAAELHPYRFVMVRRVKRAFSVIWESD